MRIRRFNESKNDYLRNIIEKCLLDLEDNGFIVKITKQRESCMLKYNHKVIVGDFVHVYISKPNSSININEMLDTILTLNDYLSQYGLKEDDGETIEYAIRTDDNHTYFKASFDEVIKIVKRNSINIIYLVILYKIPSDKK